MNIWSFCPDINPANIRANLPEKPANIRLSGQVDLIINGRTGMSYRLLLFLSPLLLVLAGCSEKLPQGLHRADSREFTMDEAKAIAVARADVEKSDHKRIDARYAVTRAPEGYRVHVASVGGYQHGQPQLIAGGFCEVLVSTQWTVLKIFRGG